MTDEVFRFIVQGNTADDLPRFDTEVDLQFQQFFSLRNFFASYDFTDAEVDFTEVIDGDFRFYRFLSSRADRFGFFLLIVLGFSDFFVQVIARKRA